MKKFLLILIPLIIIITAIVYWFFLRTNTSIAPDNGEPGASLSFNPFRRSTVTTPDPTTTPNIDPDTTGKPLEETGPIPKLRQLTTTPIGGYTASTTASSTIVRYIDRGVGHIHEITDISFVAEKITNTTIPRVYESYWNKQGTALITRYAKDEAGSIADFYGEIRLAKVSSTSPDRIGEVKGKFLPSTIHEIAVSPKGDRVFTWNIENGKGVGYISNFDNTKRTKVIESPVTLANIDWPEENTLTMNPKASGIARGNFYVVNLKGEAIMKKLIPSAFGLIGLMSHDAKYILYSTIGTNGYALYLYHTKNGTTEDVIFRTTPEKCTWSTLFPGDIICAVPTELPPALYPDDWYKGNVSFVDQIWRIDAETGNVTLLANPLNLANELVDAIDLKLDPQERYLYFVNKRDLTLWSLDLR